MNIDSTFCETQTNAKSDNLTNLKEVEADKGVATQNAVTTNELHLNAAKEVSNKKCDSTDISQTYYDSQATEIYSVHGFTQNNTHVSQSQYNDHIVTNKKFIKSKSNDINSKYDIPIENDIEIGDISKNNIVITKDSVSDYNIGNNLINNPSIEDLNKDILSQDHIENRIIGQNTDVLSLTNQNSMQIHSFSQYAQNLNEDFTSKTNEISLDIENECDITQINQTKEINRTEIVSFKVIEEMNKIKCYINRRVERRISNDGSIDSGYKTDSQKSALKSCKYLETFEKP